MLVYILYRTKDKRQCSKIWCKTNDGMYWGYKSQRPEKNEFEVIGLQVAGFIL